MLTKIKTKGKDNTEKDKADSKHYSKRKDNSQLTIQRLRLNRRYIEKRIYRI